MGGIALELDILFLAESIMVFSLLKSKSSHVYHKINSQLMWEQIDEIGNIAFTFLNNFSALYTWSFSIVHHFWEFISSSVSGLGIPRKRKTSINCSEFRGGCQDGQGLGKGLCEERLRGFILEESQTQCLLEDDRTGYSSRKLMSCCRSYFKPLCSMWEKMTP